MALRLGSTLWWGCLQVRSCRRRQASRVPYPRIPPPRSHPSIRCPGRTRGPIRGPHLAIVPHFPATRDPDSIPNHSPRRRLPDSTNLAAVAVAGLPYTHPAARYDHDALVPVVVSRHPHSRRLRRRAAARDSRESDVASDVAVSIAELDPDSKPPSVVGSQRRTLHGEGRDRDRGPKSVFHGSTHS